MEAQVNLKWFQLPVWGMPRPFVNIRAFIVKKERYVQIMTLHKFFDEDIEKVLWREGHENSREIVFKRHDCGAIILNKDDVVALAKEFSLIVYEKDSSL